MLSGSAFWICEDRCCALLMSRRSGRKNPITPKTMPHSRADAPGPTTNSSPATTLVKASPAGSWLPECVRDPNPEGFRPCPAAGRVRAPRRRRRVSARLGLPTTEPVA